MKKLLIVVMACYGLNARAQVDESKNFLYLYSDSVIFAKRISLRADVFNTLQLRADSRRVSTDRVKFFNNQDGFFANTRQVTFGRRSAFSERIIEGRINLYQQLAYEPYRYENEYGYGSRYSRPETVEMNMYYNKGYGDLKKVNYNNLKQDMADRAESMDLLKRYRKNINTARTLYIAGGASVVAGLVTFLVNGKNSQKAFNHPFGGPNYTVPDIKTNTTASFSLLGAGAGLAIGGALVHMGAVRHLEDAVDAYNR